MLENNAEILAETFPEQRLNFRIFPPGTDLRELSENIFEESTDTNKVRVDLKRVRILDDIRKLYGEDQCYIARGEKSRKTYENENGEPINEDYIILVMQHHGPNGEVASEDALAISPIAGKHATFLARQDVSEGISLRDIFTLHKNEATDFSVRRLLFKKREGHTEYDLMREKIFAIMTCQPEDFNDRLSFRPNDGAYELRKPKLRRALTAAALETSDRNDI